MPRSPFHDAEAALGAIVAERSGWLMPSRFADLAAELDQARRHGAIVDLSHWSKLKISGLDALDFVHNYTTQDVKALAEGAGLQTAVTTWKGTMVDHVFLYRLDDGLRMIGHAGTAPRLRGALEKFLIGADVELADLTAERGMLYVFGPHAAALLEEAAGEPLADLPMHAFRLVALGGADAMVARTWPIAGAGFMVLVPAEQAAEAFAAIRSAATADRSVPCIGEEAFEVLRVEAGVPAYPAEINEERNPWEVRLADSVSMRKGCYLGQEVIARLVNYQKVQRHLVGLSLPLPPPVGSDLLDAEGKVVGRITSVAPDPGAPRVLALGFLKPEWAVAGRQVRVAAGETPLEAEVRDLPFWQELPGGGVAPRRGA
jgi:folate-binding protein YgfZ